MRVLVVEDEEFMAEALVAGLRRAGFAVDAAGNGHEALLKADTNSYDVVLLDRDLPVIHGDDVCRELASGDRPARILMLTAASEVDARVEGLRIGADDYLAKPFAFEELVARLHALARRPPASSALVRVDDLEVDLARRRVRRGDRPLELTAKEFAVLQTLALADGGVVTHEELLEKAWDEYADPFTNSVRVMVMRLRRKLGDPPLIHTEVGAGYRLGR